MGLHQTSVYIGTIAGGFFAGLIGQHYGWRWSFIVFGSAGILLGIVLRRFLIEPKWVGSTGPRGAPWPGLFRNAALRYLLAAFLCANFVAVVLLSWMPKFLYDKFHMNLAMAGLTATLFAAGRAMVQAFGVLAGAPFVVLCGLTNSTAWVVVALALWGCFKGTYDANSAAGLMNTTGWLGGGCWCFCW